MVEPTGPTSSRFTEVVEGGLLGLLRPLGPLVVWLLQRQATADLELTRFCRHGMARRQRG
jgi:hypothetical protein